MTNGASCVAERLESLTEGKVGVQLQGRAGEGLRELLAAEYSEIAAALDRHGAILFRGFTLDSEKSFRETISALFNQRLSDYTGGASPREQVQAGIYESTRVPSGMVIPQHNEMSYMPNPPRRLAFFCACEPGTGGETPLADSRTIYANMPLPVRTEFETKGIRYHRYLYGERWNLHHRIRNHFVKLYTSWMGTFATKDRRVVEKFWAENGGSVTWDREDGARITNTLPATRKHPRTGEMLWFNHAATFLPSPRSTGWANWLLYQIAYPNPMRRPFHASFGDGSPIKHTHIDAIRDAIERSTVRFQWRRGDLLLLDNFLMTHGRNSFQGKRRILVAIDSQMAT